MDEFRNQAQISVQNCRNHLVQLRSSIETPAAQRSVLMIQAWNDFQTMTTQCLIPELNHLLEKLEMQSSGPVLETQLRSLNPEVTRLAKLLQIDWQFWQAARQADRIEQRQQQLLKHLQQLDQLLEAIHTNL